MISRKNQFKQYAKYSSHEKNTWMDSWSRCIFLEIAHTINKHTSRYMLWPPDKSNGWIQPLRWLGVHWCIHYDEPICLTGFNSITKEYNLVTLNHDYPAEIPESVVLASSVKPSLGCWTGSTGLVWQMIQEPLTSDYGLLILYSF